MIPFMVVCRILLIFICWLYFDMEINIKIIMTYQELLWYNIKSSFMMLWKIQTMLFVLLTRPYKGTRTATFLIVSSDYYWYWFLFANKFSQDIGNKLLQYLVWKCHFHSICQFAFKTQKIGTIDEDAQNLNILIDQQIGWKINYLEFSSFQISQNA